MSVQFSYTNQPSTVIGVDLENYQYFTINTRTGALVSTPFLELCTAVLKDVIALDKKAQAIPAVFGPNHYVKLRRIYIDDKNGSLTLEVDYLHDSKEKPEFSESDIKHDLFDGEVRFFGQGQWVEVSVKTANFSSDYFSPVSDDYY